MRRCFFPEVGAPFSTELLNNASQDLPAHDPHIRFGRVDKPAGKLAHDIWLMVVQSARRLRPCEELHAGVQLKLFSDFACFRIDLRVSVIGVLLVWLTYIFEHKFLYLSAGILYNFRDVSASTNTRSLSFVRFRFLFSISWKLFDGPRKATFSIMPYTSFSNAFISLIRGGYFLLSKPYLSLLLPRSSSSSSRSAAPLRKWKAFHLIRLMTSCVFAISCFLYSFLEGTGMFLRSTWGSSFSIRYPLNGSCRYPSLRMTTFTGKGQGSMQWHAQRHFLNV